MKGITKASATIHFKSGSEAHEVHVPDFSYEIDTGDEIDDDGLHHPGVSSSRIALDSLRLSRGAFLALRSSKRVDARADVDINELHHTVDGFIDTETLEFRGGEPRRSSQ